MNFLHCSELKCKITKLPNGRQRIKGKNRILAPKQQTVYFLYNLIVHLAAFLVRSISFFSPKLKLFVQGRKSVFKTLSKTIAKADKVVWVHASSLGEYEQGLPIIEKMQQEKPEYKILLTFFSPSGYEVIKNRNVADVIVYLPMDTLSNAKKFMNLTKPELAIFIKYEIWPNYLKVLKKHEIPTLLISAYFKKEQSFFKWYGGLMRKSLRTFNHFFVQNQKSKELLSSIEFNNCTINGDTRFDRVVGILQRNNNLDFMQQFKQSEKCLVAGSTWPKDEAVLAHYINTSKNELKYVIVPHNIDALEITSLKNSLQKKTVLYSEIEGKNLSDFDVLIVDAIGLLAKVYSYADVAYVGGGYAKGGLHNTLEPAVFGVPIIIGPYFEGFKEAEELVGLKGILLSNSKEQFATILNKLVLDNDHCAVTANINKNYVAKNQGASIQIMQYVRTLL